MKTPVKDPACNDWCPYRACYRAGADKGVFAQGRGYTHYYDKPRPACMTRLANGCPWAMVGKERMTDDRVTMQPLPDFVRLCIDYEADIAAARCTGKVRKLMRHMVASVRRAAAYIAAAIREGERIEARGVGDGREPALLEAAQAICELCADGDEPHPSYTWVHDLVSGPSVCKAARIHDLRRRDGEEV